MCCCGSRGQFDSSAAGRGASRIGSSSSVSAPLRAANKTVAAGFSLRRKGAPVKGAATEGAVLFGALSATALHLGGLCPWWTGFRSTVALNKDCESFSSFSDEQRLVSSKT